MKSALVKNISPTKTIAGSKVSVSVLIDYISDGYSLAEFLADYPWIKKENVEKVLKNWKLEEYPARYAF